MIFFFFFQAEDGIRDYKVTGVQTCALPIFREGFDELETLKRYSTVSMGPCQGRMCLMSAAALCAERTGRTLFETGSTTARPPVEPISLGLLAGAPYHSVQLTPLHYKHPAARAPPIGMGLW